jgi:hypothetical protein
MSFEAIINKALVVGLAQPNNEIEFVPAPVRKHEKVVWSAPGPPSVFESVIN